MGAGHGSYVVAKFLILIFGVFPVVWVFTATLLDHELNHECSLALIVWLHNKKIIYFIPLFGYNTPV